MLLDDNFVRTMLEYWFRAHFGSENESLKGLMNQPDSM